jgi:hypothetical protein
MTASSLSKPRMLAGQRMIERKTAADVTCHISQSMAAGVERSHNGGRQVTAHREQRIIWQLQ